MMHMKSKLKITTKLNNVHPGEVLYEEFLKPMNITAYKLAKGTSLSQTRISEIIHGKRSITVETAKKFAEYFGNSPMFWLNLQNAYDIENNKVNKINNKNNTKQITEYEKQFIELARKSKVNFKKLMNKKYAACIKVDFFENMFKNIEKIYKK